LYFAVQFVSFIYSYVLSSNPISTPTNVFILQRADDNSSHIYETPYASIHLVSEDPSSSGEQDQLGLLVPAAGQPKVGICMPFSSLTSDPRRLPEVGPPSSVQSASNLPSIGALATGKGVSFAAAAVYEHELMLAPSARPDGHSDNHGQIGLTRGFPPLGSESKRLADLPQDGTQQSAAPKPQHPQRLQQLHHQRQHQNQHQRLVLLQDAVYHPNFTYRPNFETIADQSCCGSRPPRPQQSQPQPQPPPPLFSHTSSSSQPAVAANAADLDHSFQPLYQAKHLHHSRQVHERQVIWLDRASGHTSQPMEWVVKRRPDGTRYITRRPVR
ncbi:unnamed protein product, partial [Protopolystoma xenopodis]